ncbi:MAG: hypothetical protein QXJ74_01490 [Nitrososphaera sp.]|uniref:hypothetical protein n=1 Tax=Nitrososphaera sp. TaxID=1971748 RepID=UPI0017A8D132|nr:hypothetical protein [Nitrososphaera sp.]NWG37688.1 hypothetical protein [Nitrososphaera sp.]
MRRGLATVVGAIFMIIVMIGALNVTLWMLQQQDRVGQAMVEKTSGNLDRLNEKIEIANVRIDGSKLNMTVTNNGGQPAKLKSLYVVDETAVPRQQYRYDLDIPVDGRDSAKNVGQGVPFTASTTSLYSVKLVTESGNTAASVITPVSAVALPMSLYVIPPTVTPGQNVTLLYTVTNDRADSHIAAAVTPQVSYSMGCSPGPGCQLTQYVAPSSTVINSGTTALFKWVFKVDAPDNTTVAFNATIANAKPGNYVIEKARAKLVSASETSFYSESTTTIIYSALAQKPELFLIVPSPFGEDPDDGKGLWGVMVVNPTDAPIEVSRVIISAGPVITDRTERIIDNNGTPCPRTPINPTPAAEWSCPEENMIQWRDTASPEVVQPRSVVPFLAKYEPGTLGGGGDDPAFLISASVFSSMGQFTKSGYSTGMRNAAEAIGNVYLTDTTVEATALQSNHMFGSMTGVASGGEFTMHVAMADLGRNTAGIQAGSKLIVNVPKGFTIEQSDILSWTGFDDTPTVTPFTDGSSQIQATLTNDLGTSTSEAARILKFRADAPVVPEKRIYIFFTLVHGQTTSGSNLSVGAVGEFPVQIVP